MQLFSGDATMFSKKISNFFFAPQNIKKMSSKVAHNPTRPPVFSPASFCFVKLRQFHSLKFSQLRSCQTLQDEKIAKNSYYAGTIAFHYTVLSYLYSGKGSNATLKFCFQWNKEFIMKYSDPDQKIKWNTNKVYELAFIYQKIINVHVLFKNHRKKYTKVRSDLLSYFIHDTQRY